MNNRIDYKEVVRFYKDKQVMVTGNTGFKGSWLTYILLAAGAKVIGYSLEAPTDPSLFKLIGLDVDKRLNQVYGDVRDLDAMKKVFEDFKPEVVFHMAAQPIVRDSYKDPVGTYATNVMGTVNVCECVRSTVDRGNKPVVRSFLNVTTDKVYRNNEWVWGYRETDFLDGFDPYSNSKSCSELVTHSYKNAFFNTGEGEPVIRVSTARAGNVIGGGDFSNDRIIPDCVRSLEDAVKNGTLEGKVAVRNPYSTRPYEHVLEPLLAYLMIAKAQYEDASFADYYNVGPDDCDCVNTGDLVTLFSDMWNKKSSGIAMMEWINKSESNAPHEAGFLKLDCSKLKSVFGWAPRWHIEEAIEQTVAWTKVWMEKKGSEGLAEALREEMDREIEVFVGHKEV